MTSRHARTVLQRAARFSRHRPGGPSAVRESRRLDPAIVDAALADEPGEIGSLVEAGESVAASAPGEWIAAESLLKSLRDRLEELDSHQAKIRALLDQVERRATAPRCG